MPNYLEELSPLIGFPLDLRCPRPDHMALKVCDQVFSRKEIDRVRSTFHRSHVSAQRLEDDLFEYDRKFCGPTVRSDPYYQLSLEAVRQQFTPSERLVPLTLGGVELHPDLTKNTSPGLPYFRDGFKTKGDVLEHKTGEWHRIWDMIGKGYPKNLPDCVQFYRAQTVDDIDVHKIRTTWGYPMDVLIEEGRFFFPYMEWIKSAPSIPIGYQVEIATGGMQYIDQMCKSFTDPHFGMLDWRKFDKTIPAWLIRDAFQIIADSFIYDQVRCSEGRLWPCSSGHSVLRFKKLVSYFINTPIRMFNGRRFRKKGGVPSGSMFTNIIDSIVNAIVMRFLILKQLGELPLADIYMGDDSLLVLSANVNFDKLASDADECFGMVLNTKKSYMTRRTENVHFLGYFNCDGFPSRSTDYLISSFCDPERTVRDPHITLIRAVGEMYATMNPYKAKPWYDIVVSLLMDNGITACEMEEILQQKKKVLKHLRIYGYDLNQIVIPSVHHVTEHAVWTVSVPTVPRRSFKPVDWNLEDLAKKAILYWTTLGEME